METEVIGYQTLVYWPLRILISLNYNQQWWFQVSIRYIYQAP